MKILLKSGEDYLEAIYNLSQESEGVKSVDIARIMGVSKPSICRALTKLEELNYIKKESYGDIFITQKGKAEAQHIIKKHNSIKQLLVEVLGVSPAVAEVDACKIEHNLSQETADKLFVYLKNYKR